MTINIGIVGASFAKAAYLPAIKNIHDAKVIAISSFRMDSAKSCAEEFSIPNFYDNWEEMLNSHNYDLVCVATPTDLHAPITLKALDDATKKFIKNPKYRNVMTNHSNVQVGEVITQYRDKGGKLWKTSVLTPANLPSKNYMEIRTNFRTIATLDLAGIWLGCHGLRQF